MPIFFYTATGAYGCFSNFSRHGIHCDGQWWPTVEHYFQAQKFLDPAHRKRIAAARGPKEAKALGWDKRIPLRPDWEKIKDDVMLQAVRQKFATHDEPRAILLATGDDELIENAPSDYYWGCGVDGTGRNRLGQILMQVRDEIRNERHETKNDRPGDADDPGKRTVHGAKRKRRLDRGNDARLFGGNRRP